MTTPKTNCFAADTSKNKFHRESPAAAAGERFPVDRVSIVCHFVLPLLGKFTCSSAIMTEIPPGFSSCRCSRKVVCHFVLRLGGRNHLGHNSLIMISPEQGRLMLMATVPPCHPRRVGPTGHAHFDGHGLRARVSTGLQAICRLRTLRSSAAAGPLRNPPSAAAAAGPSGAVYPAFED